MAVAFQSVSVAGFSTITSPAAIQVVITKPSGLAVGDLMIAQLVDDVVPASWSLTGWTQLRQDANSTFVRSTILYKIATSGDVAASNFTFAAPNTGNCVVGGAMLRIDGQSSLANPIWTSAFATVTNSANPSFANTITPTTGDSLLILIATARQSTNAIAGYAIATNNPTWTERWDFNTSSVDTYSTSLATALRTQATATGNSSVTGGAATADWVGQILAIAPNKDVAITDTVVSSETMTNLRIRKIDVTDTVVSTESVTTPKQRLWRTTAKPTTVWRKPLK